jgi:hypothetical protein
MQHIVANTLDLKNVQAYPKKILYPLDFFPHSNPTHQAMVEEFITTLESFLGVQKTDLSLADRWMKCPPPEAKGKSLKEYLPKVHSS